MAKSYKKYAKPTTRLNSAGDMVTDQPTEPKYKAKPKPKVPYVHPP